MTRHVDSGVTADEQGSAPYKRGDRERADIKVDDAYELHAANAYPRLVEALKQMIGAMNQLGKGHHGDVAASEMLLHELGEMT